MAVAVRREAGERRKDARQTALDKIPCFPSLRMPLAQPVEFDETRTWEPTGGRFRNRGRGWLALMRY